MRIIESIYVKAPVGDISVVCAAGGDDGHHGPAELLHQLCPLLPHVAAVQEDLQQGPEAQGPGQQAHLRLSLSGKVKVKRDADTRLSNSFFIRKLKPFWHLLYSSPKKNSKQL